VLLSFFIYAGFDLIAYLPGLKKVDELLINLGLNEHYKAISRGVIDLRDVIYFVAVSAVINEATRLVLLSRKWRKNR
jgi:ABC-2 type transport system permease protein